MSTTSIVVVVSALPAPPPHHAAGHARTQPAEAAERTGTAAAHVHLRALHGDVLQRKSLDLPQRLGPPQRSATWVGNAAATAGLAAAAGTSMAVVAQMSSTVLSCVLTGIPGHAHRPARLELIVPRRIAVDAVAGLVEHLLDADVLELHLTRHAGHALLEHRGIEQRERPRRRIDEVHVAAGEQHVAPGRHEGILGR